MSGSPDDIGRRRDLAESAAAWVADELDAVLGDDLSRPTNRRPDWDEWLRVSAFSLSERCMRRAANPADDYMDTTRTARRRIGLIALRRLRSGSSSDLLDAVRDALDDSTDWPRGLWEWTRQLDPAGRASVAAAAATWAGSLLRLLGRDDRVQWADPAQQPQAQVDRRLIRLVAPLDATSGPPSRTRLLVVADGDGSAADRLRAGHLALVRTLQQRLAPVRVSTASPSRGTVERHQVDEELLRLATSHVAAHVAVVARRELAPARPGPGCRHCHLLEVCAEGTAYVGPEDPAALDPDRPDPDSLDLDGPDGLAGNER